MFVVEQQKTNGFSKGDVYEICYSSYTLFFLIDTENVG